MSKNIAVVLLLLVSLSLTSTCESFESAEPRICNRFDYDYQVLQKLVELEKGVKKLEEKVTELTSETVELRRAAAGINRTIAFMAQLSTSMANPAKDTIVVFDDVVTKVGDGYSPRSGVFIAPVDGLYHLSLVASATRTSASSGFHLYVMHNDVQAGYLFFDSNTGMSIIRATNAVLDLKTGDTVFVKIGRLMGSANLVGCCFHTIFSGYLIKMT